MDGVVHYCVPNMPGAFGRTATLAFTNAVTPYVLQLASKGLEKALRDDPGFAEGLNVYRGKVVHKAVAESQGLAFAPWQKLN